MFKTPEGYAKEMLDLHFGKKDAALAELFNAARAHPLIPTTFWRDTFVALQTLDEKEGVEAKQAAIAARPILKGRALMESGKAVAEACIDAYSADRYSNWTACAVMLLRRGYTEKEAEAILRSKHTRWAGDGSNKKYGKVTSVDLEKYIAKHMTAKEAAQLVAETFGHAA